MLFFKNILQSVLKEKDEDINNIYERNEEIKFKTSKITNKLEKGNNGIIGDEHEEEELYSFDDLNLLNNNIDELISEDDDDDDEANYRDKDKEAKQKYIEERKAFFNLQANRIKDNLKSGTKGGNKSGDKSGKKGDWGKKTSERNLNREIGGANRDYKGEMFRELQMRKEKVKNQELSLKSLILVIRRRLKRMHINRNIFLRRFRNMLNFKRIQASLRKARIFISSRIKNVNRMISFGRMRALNRKLRKSKAIEAKRRLIYTKAVEEQKIKRKKEYEKAMQNRKNLEKKMKRGASIGF